MNKHGGSASFNSLFIIYRCGEGGGGGESEDFAYVTVKIYQTPLLLGFAVI